MIGVSHHLASELPSLMRYAQSGKLAFLELAVRFVDPDAVPSRAWNEHGVRMHPK